jgi:DNA invertase Pin-like site-specific DNA recombinase
MFDGKPLRIARYLRVSKLEQNPQLQDDESAQLAAARGWTIVDTYVDHGVSGAKERRTELDRMMKDARKRRFDAILVWRSDRLFRSLRHMVETIEELSALGVGFVSCREPFDTTTPSGKLMLHLVSAFAEFERAVLIERVKAGLAVARRKGKKIGRPRVRFDIDRARELRGQGSSLRTIAREMKVGVATLCRALDASPAAVE